MSRDRFSLLSSIVVSLRLLLASLIFLAQPLGAQGLPNGNPEELGLSSARLQTIDNLIECAIDNEEISGAVALVARHGRVAYANAFGMADSDDRQVMEVDTLFRIASMTKPVTSLAVMMLFEEGHFLLSDPIANYIPQYRNPQILVADGSDLETKAAEGDITIQQLLTHTSGISYGFMSETKGRETLAQRYRDAGISDGFEDAVGVISDLSLQLDGIPLLFEPGSEFAYGLSTDVLGHFVEVISGMSLAEFFDNRIFQPLGMKDSHFYLDSDDVARLAAVYASAPNGGIREVNEGPVDEGYLSYSVNYPYTGSQSYYSGGAGLVSTAADYARLLQMFLNNGELDGVRLLGRKTVELMISNNIGALNAGRGLKFGLGFAVIDDAGLSGGPRSRGTYFWGGIFHTRFFVDPTEQLIGIFMAQRAPRSSATIRDRFINVTYQAIED
jgi:CubicO group peptidase (beta-lactamase class C family)